MAGGRESRGERAVVRAVVMFILASVAVALNLHFGVLPARGEAFLFAGAVCYVTLCRIRSFLPQGSVDYLQTGEGWAGFIILVLAALFLTTGHIMLFLIIFACMTAISLFLHFLGSSRQKEQIQAGLVIGLIAVVSASYLVFAGFDLEVPLVMMTGYLHVIESNVWYAIALCFAAPSVFGMMRLVRPEVRLFAQGRAYLDTAGYSHRWLSGIFAVARGFLMAGVLATGGLLMSLGPLIPAGRRNTALAADFGSILMILFYLNVVFAGMKLAGPYMIPAAIAFSYVLFILSRRGLVDA